MAISSAVAVLRLMTSGSRVGCSIGSSADGTQVAWVQWDHPNMPWDSTTLLRATVTDAGLTDVRVVAGGEGISVVQPQFGGQRRVDGREAVAKPPAFVHQHLAHPRARRGARRGALPDG